MKKKKMKKEHCELIRDYMNREPNLINMQIDSMRSKLENKDMEINYEYQRNYILTEGEASKYIESVFLGCSIPEIQLFEEEDGVIEILDGQQRVMSLIKFLNNDYALTGLKELKFLNGYYFKDLPKDLCRKYKNYTLSAKIMKFSDLDDDYKFFVFERLNSGSKKLNAQETRNCVYRGRMIEMAKQIASREEFIHFYPALKNDKRFAVTEFVLRGMANAELFTMMKGTASTTMNYFLRINKDIDNEELLRLEKRYMSAISLIIEYIGVKAFKRNEDRGNKGDFSMSDIEALLINIYNFFNKYEIINNADKIIRQIYALVNTEAYQIYDYRGERRNNIMNKSMMMNKMLTDIVESGVKVSDRRFFTIKEKMILWDELKNKNGNVACAICNNNILSFNDAEVDHRIPYSKGGKTEISNGGIVHSTCNKIKGNNIPA